MTPDEILSRLLYRDALMLIIDKPAGIPVHKGSGGGDNLEQYFEHLRFGLPRAPALAHRLDRDTSGCLVLGRHRQALARLGKLFEQNAIRKTYWAVVAGKPPENQGVIDLPLARQSGDSRRWHMKISEGEADTVSAVTEYKLMGSADGISWLELNPLTGRTHQLRVHCQAMGCSIIGDKFYGVPSEDALQLHARAVTIPLYPKKEPISVTAPVPSHMQAHLQKCGLSTIE